VCGFAGILDFERRDADPGRLAAAAESLRHRGPDDAGFHREPGLGLAFRRLAIVDLAAGHQPMCNEDGTAWIVYNGEIYNHAELRNELERRGHCYHTHSDTESILHAYEEWGDDCVTRLRGMFAFALWDRPRRRLLLARDRLGIKPLYYARTPSGLVFASEVKALFHFPEVERRVDGTALLEYLGVRYSCAPRTLFAGVLKLPPAHFLAVAESGPEPPRRYWALDYEPKLAIGEEEALEELEQRLTEAVRLRLMSDVPLGALLSGGVDSSVIVALMTRLIERPVETFSVGFEGDRAADERSYARAVAEHCHSNHHELAVDPRTLCDELPRLAWHQDEPISEPAAIPTYLVSRLARQTVTVVLTGEGGDELFAGYPKYAVDPWARRLAGLPAPLRTLVLDGLVDRLPFGMRRLQVAGRGARFRDEAARYASWFAAFAGPERERLLSAELLAGGDAGREAFAAALAQSGARRPLDRMLHADTLLWLPDDLLMKMDRMSMAASVEARVPLLDHRLMEWGARLPDRLKVRGLEGKMLLKRLARRLVPRHVVDRRKVGFTVPLASWFRGPLRELLCDVLLGPASLGRGYYRPEGLRAVVEDHLEGRRDRSRELWTLLTLELWHQCFVDRSPVPPPPREVPRTLAGPHAP
jgi:asparagine synthase (glutamine-hydrolysing)